MLCFSRNTTLIANHAHSNSFREVVLPIKSDNDLVEAEAVGSLTEVIREMQMRSENISYGLGVFLGRLLGTVDTPRTSSGLSLQDRAVEESVQPSIMSRTYSWLTKVKQKSTDYLKSKIGIVSRGKIINFRSTDDHNEAFSLLNPNNAYNIFSLYFKGYSNYIHSVSNSSDICKILDEYHPQEKFEALILSAHGSPSEMHFGGEILTKYNVPRLLRCLPVRLEQNAKIILDSCLTGSIPELPFSLASFANIEETICGDDRDNMATSIYHFMASTHPCVEVAAPSISIFSLFIKNMDPLEILAMGHFPGMPPVNVIAYYNKESVALLNERREHENLCLLDKNRSREDDLFKAMRFTALEDQKTAIDDYKSIMTKFVIQGVVVATAICGLSSFCYNQTKKQISKRIRP